MGTESQRFETEMNRGFLQVLVLVVLERETYGYAALARLEAAGYPVEESTLYPLLRRLETHGHLTSRWRVEGGRPRKFYRLSAAGRRLRGELLALWRRQHAVLDSLMNVEEEASHD